MTDRQPEAATDISRRLWLAGAAVIGLPLALTVRIRSALAADPIVQPAPSGSSAFMARAFEMMRRAQADGDQAFGAAVVRDGRIVGQAPSAVITRGDPTAHAEMEAIRDAARRLGSRDLSRCTIYSTFRPCAMCEAAAYWAGIERMVHGETQADAGRPRLGRC